MTDEVKRLHSMIEQAKHIVFFGGAGVSTASGIPDFRGAHGLYGTPDGRSYEEMLSIGYFTQYPDEFWNFYRHVLLHPLAKPNPAHLALSRLEATGKLTAVITQNIDGLHQGAGSKNVLELHGSVHRNRCLRCGGFYSLEALPPGEGAPRCQGTKGKPCGGLIRPEVVLYGEALDAHVLEAAENAVRQCDLLIVGGTSLVVQPAAALVHYRNPTAELALINRDATPYDCEAGLVLREDIALALEAPATQTADKAAHSHNHQG